MGAGRCQELEDEFKRLASSDWSCLPGVYPFLDLLDAHAVPAGLVTNAPPSEMDYALAALEVGGPCLGCARGGRAASAKQHKHSAG